MYFQHAAPHPLGSDKPPRYRIRFVLISLSACALAAGLVFVDASANPVHAQSKTEYSAVDDTPDYRGSGLLYQGVDGHGYGANNYRYAYVQGTKNAAGDVMSGRKLAAWRFSRVPSQDCTLDVYIPSSRATAGVHYHVYHGARGNYWGSAFLQQQNQGGWVRLLVSEFEDSVRVYALNYEYRGDAPTADSRGYLHNRIAMDAMRIVCGNQSLDASDPASLRAVDLGRYPFTVGTCWDDDEMWDGYQPGQCTSYVAWRLRESGVGANDRAYGGRNTGFFNQWKTIESTGSSIRGIHCETARGYAWGDAAHWDECAMEIGMRVNRNPAPGSVLVNNDLGGPNCRGCGHIAYVERVNSNGSIVISDSNFKSDCRIRRSITISEGTDIYKGNVVFIHFEDYSTSLAN